MFTYLIQSSACLIILYGIYHLILAEMTFFKYNRAYLLLSMVISLMIPLLAPLLVLSEESVPVLHWSHLAGDITYIVADYEATAFDWKALFSSLLWAIYFVGVTVVLLKMIYGLSRIYRYYTRGQKDEFNGYRIIKTESVHMPFSFFNRIYISRHVPLNEHIYTILQHEEIHIRQWHTLDVLVAEIVHAFLWFNPIMLFYKKALRQSHEFLADYYVCHNKSVSSYTELLLNNSQTGLELALTNQFFQSQIKKRIQMMYTNKSNKKAIWRYGLLIPVLMFFIVVFSSSKIKTIDTIQNDLIQKDTIPLSSKTSTQSSMDNIQNISVKNGKVEVTLKNGKKEYYDLKKEEEKRAFEAKYNVPPPPPPPSLPVPMSASDITPPPPPSPAKFGKNDITPPTLPSAPVAPKVEAPLPPAPPSFVPMFKEKYKDCIYYIDGIKVSYEDAIKLNPRDINNVNVHYEDPKAVESAVVKISTNAKNPPLPPSSHDQVKMAMDNIQNITVVEDKKIVVTLKNGEKEYYDMKKEEEKRAFEARYNVPPPPPPSFLGANNEIFKIVDEMPRFPGCEHLKTLNEREDCAKTNMLEFIYTNLKYPTIARNNGTQGTCVAEFVITSDGNITNLRLLRDIGDGCGQEVIHVLQKMQNMPQKWIPGRQNGKAVAVIYTIPVSFKVDK